MQLVHIYTSTLLGCLFSHDQKNPDSQENKYLGLMFQTKSCGTSRPMDLPTPNPTEPAPPS